MKRYELHDDQWDAVKELFPEKRGKGRRFATRFEKLTASLLALVHLAFVRILLKKHCSDSP